MVRICTSMMRKPGDYVHAIRTTHANDSALAQPIPALAPMIKPVSPDSFEPNVFLHWF